MSQDVSKSIRMITQKAHGTYNGAIIDMMHEVANVISRFNHRLTKLENPICTSDEVTKTDAPVSVQEVSQEVLSSPSYGKVSEPKLSKPEGDSARKANKGTTGKAKKTPKRSI